MKWGAETEVELRRRRTETAARRVDADPLDRKALLLWAREYNLLKEAEAKL